MVGAGGEPPTYGLRVGESDRFLHALAPLRVNHLPTSKPARKQSGLVLKRIELGHIGSKRTAHLWHTEDYEERCWSRNWLVCLYSNTGFPVGTIDPVARACQSRETNLP